MGEAVNTKPCADPAQALHHASHPREECEMNLRDKINAGLKDAMRAKDTLRLSTLRLINAALKDQDIALRTRALNPVQWMLCISP